MKAATGRRSDRLFIKSISRIQNKLDDVIQIESDEGSSQEVYSESEDEERSRRLMKSKKPKQTVAGQRSKRSGTSKKIKHPDQKLKDLGRLDWYGEWPSIYNRCSAKQLVKAVKKMSQKQKKMVTSMGFGGILSLQVEGIPRKLGYYVADMFDHESMEIRLPGGSIKVNEESVAY